MGCSYETNKGKSVMSKSHQNKIPTPHLHKLISAYISFFPSEKEVTAIVEEPKQKYQRTSVIGTPNTAKPIGWPQRSQYCLK